MKKKIIEFAETKSKIVKYGKNKIEIMPYITYENSIVIAKNIYNELDKDLELENKDKNKINIEIFAKTDIINKAFIVCVLELCTDIDIADTDIDIMCSSGIDTILKNNIKNYNEVLESVKFGFAQRNIYNALNLVASRIPSSDDIKNSTKNIADTLNDTKLSSNMENIMKGFAFNNQSTIKKVVKKEPAMELKK